MCARTVRRGCIAGSRVRTAPAVLPAGAACDGRTPSLGSHLAVAPRGARPAMSPARWADGPPAFPAPARAVAYGLESAGLSTSRSACGPASPDRSLRLCPHGGLGCRRRLQGLRTSRSACGSVAPGVRIPWVRSNGGPAARLRLSRVPQDAQVDASRLAPCGCARAVVCGPAGPRGFGSGGRWSAQVDASWLAPCGCVRAVVCGPAGPRGFGPGGRWNAQVDASWLAPCGCVRAVVCGLAGPRGFGPGGRWNAQVDASWLAPCGCARAVVCGPAGPPGFGPGGRRNAEVDASWLAPYGCARAVVCGPAGPPGFGPRRRSAARRLVGCAPLRSRPCGGPAGPGPRPGAPPSCIAARLVVAAPPRLPGAPAPSRPYFPGSTCDHAVRPTSSGGCGG